MHLQARPACNTPKTKENLKSHSCDPFKSGVGDDPDVMRGEVEMTGVYGHRTGGRGGDSGLWRRLGEFARGCREGRP